MLLKLAVTFLLGLYVIIRRDDCRFANVHKSHIEIYCFRSHSPGTAARSYLHNNSYKR